MPVQEQVVVIYAGVRGHIDDVAVEDVQRFESELRAFMRASHADLLEQIATTGVLPNDSDLEAAIVRVQARLRPLGRLPGGRCGRARPGRRPRARPRRPPRDVGETEVE